MSFLKKAGQMILKVLGAASTFFPLLGGIFPAASVVGNELSKIGGVIVTTEQMATAMFGPDTKTGSQKLAAAVPHVAAIIQESELMAGKKVKDEAGFEKACTEITSGFADLLNSLEH